jgi:hypothetical protein
MMSPPTTHPYNGLVPVASEPDSVSIMKIPWKKPKIASAGQFAS